MGPAMGPNSMRDRPRSTESMPAASTNGPGHGTTIASLPSGKSTCAARRRRSPLPTDHPRTQVSGSRGGRHYFGLPSDTAADLQRLVASENATLFMAALALFNILLWRWTGQQDIVVGTPIANRDRPEDQRLIGFCLNTLAIRTLLAPQQTFRQLLRRVPRHRRRCIRQPAPSIRGAGGGDAG